jgi:16S rRNA (adenine1518-N6/adenine1519-N6)-dimethyltransferase
MTKDRKVSLFQETKNILTEYNLTLNKKLGQNYLIDDFKLKKIIRLADLKPDDTILEIGCGIGTLSLEIAPLVKKLIVIEKDTRNVKILNDRLKKLKINNVEIINSDALNIDFPKFNKIVANLPYQISSPITFKFLEYDFDYAILMYQKEFAKRMTATYDTKNYSRLSVMLHFKAKIEYLDTVSPQSFIPQPKVDSSIIKLIPKKDELESDAFFTKTCRALFQHKKKNVKKALKESFHELGQYNKDEIKTILNSLDCKNLDKKVFKLKPEEILEISNKLEELINEGQINPGLIK